MSSRDKEYHTTESLIRVAVENGFIPKESLPFIDKALKEVEMIVNGELPRKSARDFLKERRERKNNKF